MGRGGRSGGGGGFRGSSGRSFGGSVHRSSRSSVGRSSSFSGFGRTGYRSPTYYSPRRTTHVHYHTGPNVGVTRTTTSGTSSSSDGGCGCLVVLGIALILMFILIAMGNGGFTISNSTEVDEEVLQAYAEDAYIEEFGSKEGYMLVICSADGETDVSCSKYRGSEIVGIMDNYDDEFWQAYTVNFSQDLGLQLGESLSDVAKLMRNDGVKPISGGSFDRSFFKDELDWVDSESHLRKGAEEFFEASGIQVRIRLVDYNDIKGDYIETTNTFTQVLKVLVIGVVIVIVIVLLINWWKARKKQKNIEDENAIKILNTPLESFGDKELAETMEKYDVEKDDLTK